MAQRLTLKSIKNSRIPVLLNVCPDDPRIGQWVQTFEERAFSRGRWWGSTQLIRMCLTTENCVVLPAQVAAIDAVSVNGTPLPVQNVWHQFIRTHPTWNYGAAGYGLFSAGMPALNCGGAACGGSCGCGCGCQAEPAVEDRGTTCSYVKTSNNNQKIRVTSTSADNGKTITFQGNDRNGVYQSETVTMSAPFVDTATIWAIGNPVAVIKDQTVNVVRIYSVDQTDETLIELSTYQPSELNPTYRVFKVPRSCCSSRSLMAVVSLQPMPVQNDNDWLLFESIAAYTDGLMAEKYYEAGDHALGDLYFFGGQASPRNARGVLRVTRTMGALSTLEAELRRITGDISSISMQQSGLSLVGFL